MDLPLLCIFGPAGLPTLVVRELLSVVGPHALGKPCSISKFTAPSTSLLARIAKIATNGDVSPSSTLMTLEIAMTGPPFACVIERRNM